MAKPRNVTPVPWKVTFIRMLGWVIAIGSAMMVFGVGLTVLVYLVTLYVGWKLAHFRSY